MLHPGHVIYCECVSFCCGSSKALDVASLELDATISASALGVDNLLQVPRLKGVTNLLGGCRFTAFASGEQEGMQEWNLYIGSVWAKSPVCSVANQLVSTFKLIPDSDSSVWVDL